MFFKGTYNSGYTDGVSHVGIYIGNNQFVHNSSGEGETVVSDLTDGYYTNHYLGAKRITESGENIPYDTSQNVSYGTMDVKWWGDLAVIILTVLLIIVAVLFFMAAFSDIAPPEPVKQVQKLMKGSENNG